MSILGVWETKILTFKIARSLILAFFVRAAKEILCPSYLKLGSAGIYGSEDRRIFSDLSQIPTILEHGLYFRAS
jgi:hypothetical protein